MSIEGPERPPGLVASFLPRLVLAGVLGLVALTVLGWIIGAVFAVVRTIFVVGIAVAVIWAIASARSSR